MSPENWVWELCPAGRRESTVICPPIRKSFISDQGNSNKTQKPIPLYWELLERFSRPGSTVAEFTAESEVPPVGVFYQLVRLYSNV